MKPKEIYLFTQNETEFNFVGQTTKVSLFRSRMLQDRFTLFSVGSEPSHEQIILLEEYAMLLDESILPTLKRRLLELAGNTQHSGYPMVNVRGKTANGIIDKIRRMRAGNGGKPPRPDYCLADMPDVAGGRITITLNTAHDMDLMMHKIEKECGQVILEKDSFYCNPDKKYKPYRYSYIHTRARTESLRSPAFYLNCQHSC